MFEEMLTAAFLAKHATGDPTVAPAAAVLEMATLGGARALGMEDRIGSLEAGKRADIVVVDVRAPRLHPLYDPVSHLVYAAKGADVRHVVVEGRVVMRDRKVLTLDEARGAGRRASRPAASGRESLPSDAKAPPKPGRWAGAPHREPQPAQPRASTRMPTAKVVALLLDEDRRALVAAARQRRRDHAGRDPGRARAGARAAGSSSWAPGPAAGWASSRPRSARRPSAAIPTASAAVMAGGEGAVFRAVEGAEDREDDGRREGRAPRPGDLLIGISAAR